MDINKQSLGQALGPS